MSRHLYLAIALMLLVASPTWAQLRHRYSFTSDASDSVGGANGTIVDAGTTPNFSFAGGQLDLSANTGQGSNAITEDAYVDLPNGIISAAFAGGDSGEAAFEVWGTISELHTWQRFFDFGTSNDGEDTSASGSNTDQFWLAANSGRHGDGPAAATSSPTGGLGEGGSTTQLPPGSEHRLLVVFDQNYTRSGPNGTISLFIDALAPIYAPISADINLNTFVNNNNWLGRSQWNDPVFDGSYNEFRVYDRAPTHAYVQTSFSAGADVATGTINSTFGDFIPDIDLSLTVNRDTGIMTLRNGKLSIDVVAIQINSPNGSLVPANVLSVTDNYDSNSGGSFDSDNQWQYTAPTTAFALDEFEAIGDGGQLGTDATLSLQLGAAGAWTHSTYEDLEVTIQRLLPDGFTIETLNVNLVYEGGIKASRSDLDIDGDVDIDDYKLHFVAGHLTDLSGLTPATSWPFGDLDGDLDNDYQDFRLFQIDYDAANGVGAFAAMLASVPEPSTISLVLATSIPWVVSRRRRS